MSMGFTFGGFGNNSVNGSLDPVLDPVSPAEEGSGSTAEQDIIDLLQKQNLYNLNVSVI